MRHLALTALLVFLTACAPLSYQVGDERVRRPYSMDRNFIEALTANEAGILRWYADTTQKTFTQRHGTQILHLAADGSAYLVYPGNMAVLRGQWEARSSAEGRSVCYRYPNAARQPDAVYDDEGWRCDPARLAVFMTDELVDGDPLGLAGLNALPARIEPGRDISLEDYAEDLGLPDRDLPNRIPWEWRSRF